MINGNCTNDNLKKNKVEEKEKKTEKCIKNNNNHEDKKKKYFASLKLVREIHQYTYTKRNTNIKKRIKQVERKEKL